MWFYISSARAIEINLTHLTLPHIKEHFSHICEHSSKALIPKKLSESLQEVLYLLKR